MKAKVFLLLFCLFTSFPQVSLAADDNAQIVVAKEGQNVEATLDTSKEKIIFRYSRTSGLTQLLNANLSGPEGKLEIRVTPGGEAALTTPPRKYAAKKKKKKCAKKKGGSCANKAFRTSGRSWYAKMTLNGGTKLQDTVKLANGFDIPPPPPSGDDDDDVVVGDDDDSLPPGDPNTFTGTEFCNRVLRAIVEDTQDDPDYANITPDSAKQAAIREYALSLMAIEIPECFASSALTLPDTASAFVNNSVKALIYQPQKNITFVIDLIITPNKANLIGGETYAVHLGLFGPKNGPALNKLSESTHRPLQLQPTVGFFSEVYHRVKFKGSVPSAFATYEVKRHFFGYGYLFARDDTGASESGPFLSLLISKSLSTPFRAIIFNGTAARQEINWPG